MSLGQKEFDALAYIENAFLDKPKEPGPSTAVVELDVDLPSMGEYLGAQAVVEAVATPEIKQEAKAPAKTESKTKFRRRQLSAPRPRRAKTDAPKRPAIEPELSEVWSLLPKNIHFLGQFFDDAVTANYYRGEFKESRADLMRRLLDPELTLEEVSRLLGVCPATVRRYTNRGWLKHHRTKGRQRRFRLSGVVTFVEEHGRHPED